MQLKPEEKAKELYDIFKDQQPLNHHLSHIHARNSALLCVGQLRKQVLSFDYGLSVSLCDYYNKVEQKLMLL